MKNKNKIINELYEKSPDVRERIRKDVDFSQFEKKNAPAAKSSNGFKWATAVLSVALIAMIAVLAPIIAKRNEQRRRGFALSGKPCRQKYRRGGNLSY